MVQLPLCFLGITLNFMLYAASGATPTPQALAPSNSTTVASPVSVFFLSITITNRIFNESLKNQSSEDYKELRDELTLLLDDVYRSVPYNYSGISAMAFSEGSVVANTTIVFKTTEINPSEVKNLFLSYVKKNPATNLELNITEEQEKPLPGVEHQENATAGAAVWTTTPSLKSVTKTTAIQNTSPMGITNTETAVSETPLFTQTMGSMLNTTHFHSENNATISDLTSYNSSTTVITNSSSDDTTITSNDTTESPSTENTQSQLPHGTNDSTTTSYSLSSSAIDPTTHFTTSLNTSIGSTRNSTSFPSSSSTNDSLSDTSTSPTIHPPASTVMTTVISSSQNMTIHSTDIITSITSLSVTQSLPLASTTDPSIASTPSASESSTDMFATTFTPNSTSPHPNPGTTAQNASSLPVSTASTSNPPLGKTTRDQTTRTTSEPRTSPASSASASTAGSSRQEVPGWAIALLVLASLILLFLILLIIALLAYWCCKRRQYDFMNMSEDPGVYDQGNHGTDIPMYTTHSHFESSNGKPYEDPEKPMKSRKMYTVNNR